MSDNHDAFMARIEPLRSQLLSLIDEVAGRSQSADHEPSEGSPAESEAVLDHTISQEFDGPQIKNAWQFGNLQLVAAGEHFASTCRLLALPEAIVFSDKVLIRAGIEAAARSAWLLDPTVDGRIRAARGITERLYGFHSTRALTRVTDRSERDARQEGLLASARRAGYLVQTPKKRPWWVGAARPNATEVMTSLFEGGGPQTLAEDLPLGATAQGYLSLFVHSTSVGLLAVADRDMATDREGGDLNLPLTSNSDHVIAMLALATTAYVIAAGYYLTYMGWADERWRRNALNTGALARQNGR